MAVHFEANVEPVPGYRLIDRLGSGGFGEVWKCIAPGGIYKAIKIIHGDLRSKDNDLVRYAEQELKSLERVKQVRHPYLLALDRYDIVDGRLLIVMELADCNLWDRFRQHRAKGQQGIPRDELLVFMQETAEVLDLMNGEHNLLHLDVKPQNIFLQWNHVKVGDFGQVKDLQGLAAQVTGGITPVYAAPETFDGIVTKACDQYSLACVYQELLTGQRPFDGTSMNQLLMQHLAAPPNLTPSPEGDRPALRKALAKKSEERFPTCAEFVRALRVGTRVAAPASGGISMADINRPTVAAVLLGGPPPADGVTFDLPAAGGSTLAPPAAPRAEAGGRTDTPYPAGTPDADPPRTAPPEQTGAGPFQPALVIGLGGTGLHVLQRLRADLADRFGSGDALPAVRSLYIDTDPQTPELAATDKPWERLAKLAAEQVFPARLNRPTHYMKPRLAGQTIMDGWFDPQLLNKLQRTPTTMGLRPLGRLAFVDHYRALNQKFAYDLESILDPDAVAATLDRAGLDMRSNRPRVYVVAALAGGTGGGMFLDVAYAVRHRLKKMGYANPEVVGVLFVPPDGPPDELPPPVRANVCAALTELNHYGRGSTVFNAFYDERSGGVRDSDPPFHTTYVLPAALPVVPLQLMGNSAAVSSSKMFRKTGAEKHPAARKSTARETPGGTDDPVAAAAERIRLDLFSPVGRTADEARPRSPTALGLTVRTFGRALYSWPRGAIVDRTARVLTGVLLTHWVSPDITRARHLIPPWVSKKMAEAGLSKDAVQGALHKAAAGVFNEPLPTVIARIVDPATPKGWMARTPDVNKVIAVLDQLGKAIGHPTGQRLPNALEDALRLAAADIVGNGGTVLTTAIQEMIDDPHFRTASAEEALQQILSYLHVCRLECEAEADRAEKTARVGYDPLMAYVHPQSNGKKPSAAEIGDALRTFPGAQFQAAVARRSAKLFEHMKAAFADLRAQIAACRQRLEVVQKLIVADLEQPAPPVDASRLMPPGCGTIEDAAQRYLAVLTDDDLQEVERLVQVGIEEAFGGLYQASMNSTVTPEAILAVVRSRARFHLNARLGEVDLAGMFTTKCGGRPQAAHVLANAYGMAKPALVGNGPWVNHAITVLGTPAGPGGEQLRQMADQGFPADDKTVFAATPDEVTIYREYPFVQLSALPQFGPAWESAYLSPPDGSPHARLDVTQWIGVDAE
jgi:hypothetical protein